MTQTKQPKHQPTELSQRIRTLLKEGRSTQEIMALTGTRKHLVGLVKYHMERQENIRISPLTGKPVRKYRKRGKVKAEVLAAPKKKAQALIVIPKPEFLRMKEELETLRNRRPVEVEIPVPQPFSHYTFWQRLRILFLGGAA